MALMNGQLNALRMALRRNRRSFEVLGERYSQRYRTDIEDSVDASGYSAIVLLLEQGLGNEHETVQQVLHLIAAVQGDDRLKYPVYLLSFGADGAQLVHAVRPRQGSWHVNVDNWVTEICDLSGTAPPASPAVLPAFFPEGGGYGPGRTEWHDALPIVIARGPVQLGPTARAQLNINSSIAKRAIWIVYGPSDPELYLGELPSDDSR